MVAFPKVERPEYAEINALTDEYQAWNKAQGLDLGSADEHLNDDSLTGEQQQWLSDFCERWDAAERRLSEFWEKERKGETASS